MTLTRILTQTLTLTLTLNPHPHPSPHPNPNPNPNLNPNPNPGYQAPDLFEAIAQEAQGRVGEFKEQNLANTAWAFAVADARCDALFGGPQFVQACERHGKSLLGTRAALRQLEVWRQWRDACSADGRTWPTLPAPLLAACQASKREEAK